MVYFHLLLASLLFCYQSIFTEDQALVSRVNDLNKFVQDSQPKSDSSLKSISDDELKNRIQDLDNHGWAVIDRIKNETPYPINVFYSKTLHDLLPPGTVIRIKSKKQEYASLVSADVDLPASSQAGATGSSQSEQPKKSAKIVLSVNNNVAAKKTSVSSRRKIGDLSYDQPPTQQKKEVSKAVAEDDLPSRSQATGFSGAVTVVVDDKFMEQENPPQKQLEDVPYRYLAARNLAGEYRLRADSINPDDPATRFVIRKQLDPDLQTFLGIESEVAPGKLLRMKKNNEIILFKNSTIDSIAKGDQKSNDNFSSPFDMDSHWMLFSKGTGPSSPINVNEGRYLLSCNLKNQLYNSFASVRSALDENSQNVYIKPRCFWFWTEGAGEIKNSDSSVDRKLAGPFSASTEIIYNYYWHYDVMKMEINRSILVPLNNSPASFATVFNRDFNEQISYQMIKDRHPVQSGAKAEYVRDVTGYANGRGKFRKGREDSIREDARDIDRGFLEEEFFTSLEQGLMIYNHARDYEYGPSKDGSGYGSVVTGKLLDFWKTKLLTNSNSIQKRVLAKKRGVVYGDKVRLVSTCSFLTLYGMKDKPLFGSHDDTSAEYDKFNKLDKSFPTSANSKDSERKAEDLGWFYIKGPHADGDRWNCKIGMPVLDGDVVRLEHVDSERNITINKKVDLTQKAKVLYDRDSYLGSSKVVNSNAKYEDKPLSHEVAVELSPTINPGVGSSNDNFVIKFYEPQGSNLCVGQRFSLVHQNTKHHLWSQHAYFDLAKDISMGFVSAVYPTKDDDANAVQWFVAANSSASLPVKDVVWGGAPDGAIQDSAGDAEELEIEVVKLGLAGNIGAGETMTVNMPLQKKEPKVAGFAQDTVVDFGIEQIVDLSPLRDSGIAWLERALKTPDKAIVFFRAKATDVGGIQVVFGSEISLDYQWKVVIGGGNNSSSYILKREVVGGVVTETKVTEIFKAKNPLAGAIPGQYTPYWISIDEGVVLVGVGSDLGSNIILAWKDSNQREPINRIGFSSGEKSVSYAEVRITDPLEIVPPSSYYFVQKSPLLNDPDGSILFQNQAESPPKQLLFKVPGNATMSFSVDEPLSLYFLANDIPGRSIYISKKNRAEVEARVKSEIVVEITQILDKISMQLNLKKFFDNADLSLDSFGDESTEGTSEAKQKAVAKKKDLLSTFPKEIGLSLKTYLVETKVPAESIKIIKAIIDNDYAVIKNNSISSIKKALEDVIKYYVKDKLKAKSINPKLTDDKILLVAGFVIGKVTLSEQTSTDKNTLNILDLVNASYMNTIIKGYDKINEHYRLRFQDQKTILAKKTANKNALVSVLQPLLSDLSNNNGKPLSESDFNKKLVSVKDSFQKNLKNAGAGSLDVDEVFNRLRTIRPSLLMSIDKLASNFEKAFPDEIIESYLQKIPEFVEAKVMFEKYSQINDSYELLTSSKGVDSFDPLVVDDSNYWCSFNNSRFFLGQGSKVGQNLIMFYWDVTNPIENIQRIGFSSSTQNLGSLQNFKLGNTVKLAMKKDAKTYSKEKAIFDYGGSLEIIAPYEYHLSQNDQQVQFVDMISKRTYFPGKTPQQGALYYFTLSMEKNGFPNPQWTKEPENKLKIELDRRVTMHQAKSDSLYQASTYVQGMGAIGGLIGVLASVGFAVAGQQEGEKAAEMKAEASTAFRSHDSYVFTDSMSSMGKLAKDSIPPQALVNRDKVSELLDKVSAWLAGDLDKLQKLIPLYQQILDLIIHPAVIEARKNVLYSGLSSIYKANNLLSSSSKTIDISQKVILELFLKAYNNPYLIDEDNSDELNIKKTWYSYIGDLARDNIAKSSDRSISLPPTYGEYIWLPQRFKKEGVGSISFSARANNDIFVCFSGEPTNIRNSDKDIYEVVFGAWDNSKTVIRSKSLDRSVVETAHPDTLANPVDYKKYWISFNKGRILLGTGDFSPENVIGQYDPDSREVSNVVWKENLSAVELNREWLKLVIGNEEGFEGKDTLLDQIDVAKTENEKVDLSRRIIALRNQLASLAEKGVYPYQLKKDQVSGSFEGSYFYWDDYYYDKFRNKVTSVGIGSWDTEVSFKDIRVGGPVEEASMEQKNLACVARNAKDINIYENDLEVDAYKKKVLDAIAKSKIKTPSSTKVDEPKTKVDEPKTKVDEPKTKVDEPKTKVDEPKTNVEEQIDHEIPVGKAETVEEVSQEESSDDE